MFVWDDCGEYIELIEGKRFYSRILLSPGEVRFVQDEEEEIFRYKLQQNSEPFFADSWKVQSLQHFTKIAAEKDFDTESLHFVVTETLNGFTHRYSEKNILLALYCSADYTTIKDEISIRLDTDGYVFFEPYRFKRFVSSQNDLLAAVHDCAAWYADGMPEQTIELWNITTVAEKFGKQRQNIHKYYKEGKLPAPFATVKDVPYWHPKQVGELSRALTGR